MENLIRERFKATGWSIKKLADTSGVHYAAVHGFVTGDRAITLRTAEKLCMVLGLALRPTKIHKRP